MLAVATARRVATFTKPSMYASRKPHFVTIKCRRKSHAHRVLA